MFTHRFSTVSITLINFRSQVLHILFKGSIFRWASRPFHLQVKSEASGQ